MSVVDINPLPRQPIWTPKQAVTYAAAQTKKHGCPHHSDLTGYCLHWSACTYGFAASGVYDAISFWKNMPHSMRFTNRNAPKGSLAIWSGGSSGHGHIAPVVGNSLIASTDIRREGYVDVVPLGEIESSWGQHYEGWVKPYFYAALADHRDAPKVYSSAWDHGDVLVARLHYGMRNSDSVRRLQHRLAHVKDLPNALVPKRTGNYGNQTRDAVRWWQNHNGFKGGKGVNPGNQQANQLFGSNYFVKPQ